MEMQFRLFNQTILALVQDMYRRVWVSPYNQEDEGLIQFRRTRIVWDQGSDRSILCVQV